MRSISDDTEVPIVKNGNSSIPVSTPPTTPQSLVCDTNTNTNIRTVIMQSRLFDLFDLFDSSVVGVWLWTVVLKTCQLIRLLRLANKITLLLSRDSKHVLCPPLGSSPSLQTITGTSRRISAFTYRRSETYAFYSYARLNRGNIIWFLRRRRGWGGIWDIWQRSPRLGECSGMLEIAISCLYLLLTPSQQLTYTCNRGCGDCISETQFGKYWFWQNVSKTGVPTLLAV